MTDCPVVVFSAAGRHAVLQRTVKRLASLIDTGSCSTRILCLDGFDDRLLAIKQVDWFTHLRVNVQQQGYFANLLQAVTTVQHPFLFACEDDFELTGLPPFSDIAKLLEENPAIVQVRVPKNDYLLLEDKRAGQVASGIWAQHEFYSLNPHYCRAEFLRSALEYCKDHGCGRNIEVAISEWMRRRQGLGACFAPTRARAVHFGHEMEGGKSDYQLHATPSETESPASLELTPEPQLEQHGTTPDQPLAKLLQAPQAGSLRAASELLAKGGYAMWAVVWSTLAIPFSRQARVFLRTVWSYWHPDRNLPTYLGIGADENG